MVMKFLYSTLILILIFSTTATAGSEKEEIIFALAKGYPPYQFQSELGVPVGVDVEVIKLLADQMDIEIKIVQGPWDEMVAALRLGQVDCVGGMEINEKRQRVFDFTTPYYSRSGAVFTLKENQSIRNFVDLTRKFVAGDRHSYVDALWADLGLKQRIRIRHTESKDHSIQLLKRGEVVAVVAPKAVGYYLAAKHEISVRIIDGSDPGTPVGLAVSKGNTQLLERLESALKALREDGKIDAVMAKWNLN